MNGYARNKSSTDEHLHAVPVADLTLEGVHGDLMVAEKMMDEALGQADEIIGRLVGSRPCGQTKEAKDPMPSGVAYQLRDRARSLNDKIGQMHSALSLIARTVG